MQILFFDCFAGISGDMALGALIDLGVDEVYLKAELAKLPITGYRLQFTKELKSGISGTRALVDITGGHEGHHHHRTFADIRALISNSSLHTDVKEHSLKIFQLLASAEATIHNKPVDKVHFHEVGAVDSIVDIVGFAICFHSLKPQQVFASSVELGGGMVKCAHGTFPIPAPATAQLLKDVPVSFGAAGVELTTPTGAAILAATVDGFETPNGFAIQAIGYGHGSRDLEIPNTLRVFTGSHTVGGGYLNQQAFMVECNIDDMNPEWFGHLYHKLFEAGADDVTVTPILMKKMRPAHCLSVLCGTDKVEGIKALLLRETTTFGIRSYRVTKSMLERSETTLQTPYGPVSVKHGFLNGQQLKWKAEYDDCVEAAKNGNIPLAAVYSWINTYLESYDKGGA